MVRTVFHSNGLPDTYENLLEARIRPTGDLAHRSAAAATSGKPIEPEKLMVPATPGLKALTELERAGRIRSVTAIARTQENARFELGFGRGAGLAEALVVNSAAPNERVSDLIARGVHIIETESERDAETLRQELSADPHVEHVSRVPVRYLLAAPAAVPPAVPAGTLWNLAKIRWSDARQLDVFREPEEIRVAVLDSGVDLGHPDLDGRVHGYVHAYPDVAVATSDRDLIGHGTHVAGTIGATINDQIGIAGVCHCRLMAWKIFPDAPQYVPSRNEFMYFVDPTMYLRALLDCFEEGVEVINLSIGGPGKPSPSELQIFNALLARNTAVVAAMGNDRAYGSPISYPAAIPDVIAVGATRPDDRVARFSNRGPHIWISAPGVAVWSTLPRYPGQTGYDVQRLVDGQPTQGKPHHRETDYDAWDGTSMAAPHVAGAIACLLARTGPLPLGEIRERLKKSARPLPGMGELPHHPDYGYGRLDLATLLS